jgi:outer membrane beta-barrel protein
MKNLGILSVFILSLLMTVQSYAQYQSRDKKINTRKLVDDYWTPSDKKYSLIQQRYFVKSGRIMLSATAGVHVNNPQHEGYLTQLSAGYFLSETLGFEVQYANSSLKGNDVIDQLDGLNGGATTLDRTKTLNYIGGAINYSPVYAKMSFLGYKILYYDLILSGQLGQTEYQQTQLSSSTTASSLTVGFGITQLFYLNKNFSLRVDFNNRFYSAEVIKFSAPNNKVKDRTINDTQHAIGVSFML